MLLETYSRKDFMKPSDREKILFDDIESLCFTLLVLEVCMGTCCYCHVRQEAGSKLVSFWSAGKLWQERLFI